MHTDRVSPLVYAPEDISAKILYTPLYHVFWLFMTLNHQLTTMAIPSSWNPISPMDSCRKHDRKYKCKLAFLQSSIYLTGTLFSLSVSSNLERLPLKRWSWVLSMNEDGWGDCADIYNVLCQTIFQWIFFLPSLTWSSSDFSLTAMDWY